LRDAIFGRQRYWGEPIPVYYKNNIPFVLNYNELPLELPKIDKFLPTESGEPPLGRAKDWKYKGEYNYENSTMPGWAGSSWYFLRYMDNKNNNEFVSKQAVDYWQQVDLYLGGSEHATGHLLYIRFWTKFLFDLGLIPCDEPAKKLINQGMITGRSSFVYKVKDSNKFVSFNLKDNFENYPINVDVNFVKNDVLNIEAFKNWRDDYANAEFILEDGKYICGTEIEKMSKSKYNVVNPDEIVANYGADTLRLYEMFLGPLEQSKPWNTNGIEGVHRFLKKFCRLFFDVEGNLIVTNEDPTKAELKTLHKTIKKVTDDIENFSFNTSVSNFMICVNELTDLKCNKQSVLQELLIILSPYAPHIAEELWNKLGNKESITKATFPIFNGEYLIENEFSYPISINGKHRTNLTFSMDLSALEIESAVLANELVQKWLEGKTPKKVVFC
jgi:leucyl-tRNA synthetase